MVPGALQSMETGTVDNQLIIDMRFYLPEPIIFADLMRILFSRPSPNHTYDWMMRHPGIFQKEKGNLFPISDATVIESQRPAYSLKSALRFPRLIVLILLG